MDFCYGSQCLKHFYWLCGHKEGIKSLKALAIPRYKMTIYKHAGDAQHDMLAMNKTIDKN